MAVFEFKAHQTGKEVKVSVIDLIGIIISLLVFILMSYQLIRSCCHYKRKHQGDKKSVYSIHTICFAANILYALYSFN